MNLDEKLQLIRRKNGLSQEQLADKLGVSRQTIGKWENGQAIPELTNMIELSHVYGMSIDRIVKDDDACNIKLIHNEGVDLKATIDFLLKAKRLTYAAGGAETTPSRIASHDLEYKENDFFYYDTYLGGECFTGEEAVWHQEVPIWSMNYSGRVIGENFSGDFLKLVLSNCSEEMPFRGPVIFRKGDYSYHCKLEGAFIWFQGYEAIFYGNEKIYECYFHGGIVK